MSGEQEAVRATIGLYEILQLAGISAIVSGIISTILNYAITVRESRKERRITVIQEKLSVYSALIYHIDKQKVLGEVMKEHDNDAGTEELYLHNVKDLENIHAAVDHIFETKFHLLNHDILKEWLWVKTLHAYPSAKEHMTKLRQLLVTEYNNTVRLLRDVVGHKWANEHGVIKEIT